MRYVKITRPELGKGGYIHQLRSIGEAIDGEFDGADPGDKIVLELIEMAEEEYEKIPEFQGW